MIICKKKMHVNFKTLSYVKRKLLQSLHYGCKNQAYIPTIHSLCTLCINIEKLLY